MHKGKKVANWSEFPENYQMVYNQIEHTLYSFGPFSVMVLAKWGNRLQIYASLMYTGSGWD